MYNESLDRQLSAKNELFSSEYPFAEETLEKIGEVEGVIHRLSDGRLVTTPEMTAEIIGKVRIAQRQKLRLSPGSHDEEKPGKADY